jgi:uncharacterized protein DUF6502
MRCVSNWRRRVLAVESSLTEESSRELALRTMLGVFKPVVSMLLDVGVSCHDLTHLIRWAYVHQAAARQIGKGRKASASRIAAATGLSRADVRELLSESPLRSASSASSDRAGTRVLVGWRSDPDFLDASGAPKTLSYANSEKGFVALAHRYARDIPPRAMLNELLDSQHVVEVNPGEYTPSLRTGVRLQSEKTVLANFGDKMGPLAASLLQDLRATGKKPAFDALVISEKVQPHLRARIARDLERRCRNFSSAIERYLLDQALVQDFDEDVSRDSARLGVLVACIKLDAPEMNSTAEAEGNYGIARD